MKQHQIEQALRLGNAIDNFKDCYESCVIWGSAPDGDVKAEKMIEWLIENEHMMDIAKKISELTR